MEENPKSGFGSWVDKNHRDLLVSAACVIAVLLIVFIVIGLTSGSSRDGVSDQGLAAAASSKSNSSPSDGYSANPGSGAVGSDSSSSVPNVAPANPVIPGGEPPVASIPTTTVKVKPPKTPKPAAPKPPAPKPAAPAAPIVPPVAIPTSIPPIKVEVTIKDETKTGDFGTFAVLRDNGTVLTMTDVISAATGGLDNGVVKLDVPKAALTSGWYGVTSSGPSGSVFTGKPSAEYPTEFSDALAVMQVGDVVEAVSTAGEALRFRLSDTAGVPDDESQLATIMQLSGKLAAGSLVMLSCPVDEMDESSKIPFSCLGGKMMVLDKV